MQLSLKQNLERIQFAWSTCPHVPGACCYHLNAVATSPLLKSEQYNPDEIAAVQNNHLWLVQFRLTNIKQISTLLKCRQSNTPIEQILPALLMRHI
jgi:hypothetical protein